MPSVLVSFVVVNKSQAVLAPGIAVHLNAEVAFECFECAYAVDVLMEGMEVAACAIFWSGVREVRLSR